MNNGDFQRLLLTNDKALVKELTSAPKKNKKNRPPPEIRGKGKGKKGVEAGVKGKGGAKGAQAEEKPVYRDRAKERREGKDEYETINAEWENHAEVELDQSKYLGGDVEHTHLVKGLDFALLSKVRNELNKQTKSQELADQRAQKKVQKKRTFTSNLAKNVFRTVVETLHPHHTTFAKRLQGMCKAISMGQRIRGAPSVFLPGRMEYEFETGAKEGPTDIPRIIYISKDDAPNPDWSRKVASALPETVAKVRTCLLRAAEERKRRKQEKTLGAEASYKAAEKIPVPGAIPKPKAKDLDEDIFAGAGGFNGAEFAAKEAKKRMEAAAKAAGKSSSSSSRAKTEAPETRKPSYFADAGSEKYLKGVEEEQLELDDVAVNERDGPTDGAALDEDEDNFEASDKFRGARAGWVFKLGPQGLGYYLDDPKKAAAAAKAKADAAALAGHSKREPMRKTRDQKAAAKAAKEAPVMDAVDDDAYGECFPSAMMGHALVMTGEDGSDEEDDSAKKKIEKLKKLAEKDSADGKKGKEAENEKKRKKTENQEWQKIDQMIKKGKHSSFGELEAQAAKKRADGPRAPREVNATPAYF